MKKLIFWLNIFLLNLQEIWKIKVGNLSAFFAMIDVKAKNLILQEYAQSHLCLIVRISGFFPATATWEHSLEP